MKNDIEKEMKKFLKDELGFAHRTYNIIYSDELKKYAESKGIDLTGCKGKAETAAKITKHISIDELMKDFPKIGIPGYRFEKEFHLDRSEVETLESCGILKRVSSYEWKGYQIPVYSPVEFFKWEEEDFRAWLRKYIEMILPVRIWTKTKQELDYYPGLFGESVFVISKRTYANREGAGYYHYLTAVKYRSIRIDGYELTVSERRAYFMHDGLTQYELVFADSGRVLKSFLTDSGADAINVYIGEASIRSGLILRQLSDHGEVVWQDDSYIDGIETNEEW